MKNAVIAAPACACLALRRLFTGRRQIAAAVLLALPVLIALVVSMVGGGAFENPERAERVFHMLMCRYVLYLMIMLVCLIFALSFSSGDIEDGTAGYLFLTAMPRWLIALIHVVVSAVVLSVLVSASILAARAAWRLGAGNAFTADDLRLCFRYSVVAAFGVGAYLSFFTFCGYAFRRPVAWSIGAVILWEFVLTHMPVKIAVFTVTNNLRALVIHGILEGKGTYLIKYARNHYAFPDYTQAALTLSIVVAVWLAAAMVAVMNRNIEGRQAG